MKAGGRGAVTGSNIFPNPRKGCLGTFCLGGTSPWYRISFSRLHNRCNLTIKSDQNLQSPQLIMLSLCPGMFPQDASTVSSILRKGDETFSVAFYRTKARQLLQLVDAFTPGSVRRQTALKFVQFAKRAPAQS
jgi:hypothetical protein